MAEIERGPRVGVPGGAQLVRPAVRLETPLSDAEKELYAGIIGAPKAPPGREDNKPVSLVVDNHPARRGVMREAMEGIGLRVFETGDGAKALQEYACRTTDLVLLDMTLPSLDGFKLIRGIRSYCGDARVLLCCVSDRDDIRDETTALNLGADDFMTGPCTVERLRAHVRSVFRAKKSGL